MFKKTQVKFKTYKSDAAPFFFYIEIFPFDMSRYISPYLSSLIKTIEKNPVVPIPMRVDRVSNGDLSVIIRPREPISFQISEDKLAVINPYQFLLSGVKNLIYFSEIRSSEKFYKSLSSKNVMSWWEATRFLYGNLNRLEEDFSSFLRAYLHTMVRSYVEGDDLMSAAIQYCQIIEDICKKRMEQNRILVEIDGEESALKLYKEKTQTYYKKLKKVSEKQYHPELVDIEIINYSSSNWPKDTTTKNGIEREVKKYIPLLFYDDLQECMLLNLQYLEDNEKILLNPSTLIEENIISIIDLKNFNDDFKIKNLWWNDFSNIKPELFLDKMLQSPLK
ncbi:MAG: hypothetical protein KGD67_02960 [Candidatus Lokiarchaeota archaeon]|nr:hypothetical protein [Candidatus Lokiarchaeota archaeon]